MSKPQRHRSPREIARRNLWRSTCTRRSLTSGKPLLDRNPIELAVPCQEYQQEPVLLSGTEELCAVSYWLVHLQMRLHSQPVLAPSNPCHVCVQVSTWPM
jgi:hypothetical protein